MRTAVDGRPRTADDGPRTTFPTPPHSPEIQNTGDRRESAFLLYSVFCLLSPVSCLLSPVSCCKGFYINRRHTSPVQGMPLIPMLTILPPPGSDFGLPLFPDGKIVHGQARSNGNASASRLPGHRRHFVKPVSLQACQWILMDGTNSTSAMLPACVPAWSEEAGI